MSVLKAEFLTLAALSYEIQILVYATVILAIPYDSWIYFAIIIWVITWGSEVSVNLILKI